MKKISIVLSCILLLSFTIGSTGRASEQVSSSVEFADALDSTSDNTEELSLVQTMEKYRFRAENINRVRNILFQADQEELPPRPIIDKVYEGISKNIAQNRIVAAAETVRNRYANAYRIAKELSANTEVQDTLGNLLANSSSAGLQTGDSGRIVSALQARTRSMDQSEADQLKVQVWTMVRTMAYRAVQSKTIGDVAENGMKNGYGASDFSQVRNAFERQSRYGSAENSARGLSTDISNGREAGSLGRGNRGSGGSNGGSGGSNGGSGGSSGGSGGSNGGSGGSSGGSGGSNGGSGGSSGGSGGSNGGSGGSSGGSGGSSGGSGGSNGGSGGSSGGSGGSNGGSGGSNGGSGGSNGGSGGSNGGSGGSNGGSGGK